MRQRNTFKTTWKNFISIFVFDEQQSVLDALDEKQWQRTRAYMFATGMLVLVWGGFDFLIDYENLWMFLTLRFIYTPLTLTFAWFFYLPWLKKHHKKYAMLHYVLLIVDIGIMVLWTDAFLKYLIGFSTIFWGASVLMLWRFRNTVVPGLFVIVIAFIRFYFFDHNVEFGELITGFYYFFTCLVFTSIISAVGWWSAYHIQASNIKLFETQNQLIESEKLVLLGRMVVGVAHEINTPVGTITTTATLLEDKMDRFYKQFTDKKLTLDDFNKNIDTFRECIDIVIQCSKRAGDLTANFKQVSMEQNRDELSEFNVYDNIESTLFLLRPQLKHRAIEIQVGCPKTLVIHSYPGSFSQLTTNFITNALCHAFDPEEQGTIYITVSVDAGILQFVVQDNGKGISEEHMNEIFEPFFTTNRAAGGTGLGLNIAHTLVLQRFKGSIHCESQLGQGAQFIIRFPVEVMS